MPDLDHLPRGIRHAWAKSAGALRGRQPPLYLADLIEAALAAETRRLGDLAPVGALEAFAARSFDESSLANLRRYVADLPREYRTGVGAAFVQSAHAILGAAAADSWRSPTPMAVLVRGLQRMVDKCLFGPCEPALGGGPFSTPEDFSSYRAGVMSLVRFQQLADKIVSAGYDGQKVRAPNHRFHRPSTSELLPVPLE